MLSQNATHYLELHRAMGFKFRIQGSLLRSFVAFAEPRGDEFVCTQSVLDWAAQAPSPPQRRNRLLTVRRFALAMHAENERHAVPPADALGSETFKRHQPHIFSQVDIARLLAAAAQLPPKDSIRPVTYTTLFALLAASGLRISEALALKLKDITDDGLLIRATKFRKNRLVPLHETTQRALNRYLACRAHLGSEDPAVFLSQRGTALRYSTVVTVFLKLVRSLGLHPGPGHRGPRLHHLRHTFAVRSLEQCPSEPEAVSHHMTALSTYLGHAHVSDTYWYLQATPLLMTQIAAACETLFKGEPT
jgi:integrase